MRLEIRMKVPNQTISYIRPYEKLLFHGCKSFLTKHYPKTKARTEMPRYYIIKTWSASIREGYDSVKGEYIYKVFNIDEVQGKLQVIWLERY